MVVISAVLAISQADHLTVVPPVVLLDAFVGIVIQRTGVVLVTATVTAFVAITPSRVVVPGSIDAGRICVVGPPFRCRDRARDLSGKL